MATPTYVPLGTITLSSTDSEIVFSSIPATYRDLVLVFIGTNSTSSVLGIRVNGDTGSNYPRVFMYGTGSGSGTSGSATDTSWRLDGFGTAQQIEIVQFFDYSATDKHKTILWRGNNAASFTSASAGRWANTAAIDTIRVAPEGGSLNIGTTLSLYGIAG